MDRLDAMALLREAVDAGSLSAAGRSLSLSPATISRRISGLEDELGVQLLFIDEEYGGMGGDYFALALALVVTPGRAAAA